MKNIKSLVLFIAGDVMHTTRLTLPEDGSDVQCPVCFSAIWNDLYGITQYGFDFEDHIDIVRCERCSNVYHIQYSLKD